MILSTSSLTELFPRSELHLSLINFHWGSVNDGKVDKKAKGDRFSQNRKRFVCRFSVAGFSKDHFVSKVTTEHQVGLRTAGLSS